MSNLINIIQLAAAVVASILVGNWFMDELKKARAMKKPMYHAYLTIPGLIIIAALILLPILLWWYRK
jgi:hypothetical protein